MATLLKRPEQLTGDLVGLIDYDIITYSAGFASDNKYYITPDGEEFKYKREAVTHCEKHQLHAGDIESLVESEPIEHCLFTVKQMINNICKEAGCGSYMGYLTGSNNFRDTIDTIQPYKGNRVGSNRPLWYDEIREYLIKNQNGIVVDGYEADDAMAMEQMKDPDTTIICTKDKDLWMVPGWKYNFGKEPKKFFVDPIEGMRWFYTQLLIGDATDNIMGCGVREIKVYQSGAKKGRQYNTRSGVGEKEAELILMTCHNERDMYEAVLECYEDYELDQYDLLENANLLWMVRERDSEGRLVHWSPPV